MAIDYAALGMRAMVEDKEAQGDLHIAVEDGEITLEQIGRTVYKNDPNHPSIAEFDPDTVQQGGWEQDFANLPTIPGPDVVGAAQGVSDFLGISDLGRGLASGATAGGTEAIAQGFARMNRRLGAPAYRKPDGVMFDVGEFAGSMMPYMRGYKLMQQSKWLQTYLSKFPRAKEYLQDALLGAGLETTRDMLDPERELDASQTLGHAAGGALGTGITRGLGAAKTLTGGMISRPPKGPGSLTEQYPLIGPQAEKLASWVGLTKQAIDGEFVKVLDKYGYPHVPAVVRPLDVGVRYATKKVVRASSALPNLAKVNQEILQAMERHKANVVQMLRPPKPTKVQGIVGEGSELFQIRNNTDTGNIVRIAYREQVDGIHNQADELYGEANRILGKSDVDTKNLINRLKKLIEEEAYDDPAMGVNSKVNKVKNIIKDLESLSIDKPGGIPEGPISAGSLAEFNAMVAGAKEAMEATGKEVEYKPAKFDWVHNRYKSLRKDISGPTDDGDRLQFMARDIIRRELSDAAAKHSDSAASLMQQANTKWAMYKKMRWPNVKNDENPMGKIIYESKGDNLVPKMFESVTNIRQSREYLNQEAFELARQRHLQNIMFTAKPKTLMPNQKPNPNTVEEGIDISSLNSAIESAGGIDGEIWQEMFKGEPEKFAALVELHKTVNRFSPIYSMYRGVAEEAGGGEQGGLLAQFKQLLGQGSMAIQLGMMKKLSESMTRPQALNRWVGGKAAQKPVSARQDAMRAGVTQLSARLTGEGLK